jgi:4-amino-4-deoxy-L-arabinose transferase-like glycosyltransferase
MPSETLFEWMERIRLVDNLLLVVALFLPLLVAGLAWLWRGRGIVENHKPDWFLAVVAGPVVFLLWRGHSAIMDRFGVETLRAFFLSAFLILGVAAALTGLMRILDQRLGRGKSATDGDDLRS